MKQNRFNENQILEILKEQRAGKSVTEICRTHQISQPTFYTWKNKYSDMNLQQIKDLKSMEKELGDYKSMVAELSRENRLLKEVITKKL
jgi:putative transposase